MPLSTTSCGSNSSSSGFSSDEDTVDVSDMTSSSSCISSVHVEVLDEIEETCTTPASSCIPIDSQVSLTSSNILQCCREVTDTILQTSKPLNFQYEQYTAAIDHITSHWPTAEHENNLKSYHSLRAKLYGTFQLAHPLTEDMYFQWIKDCLVRGDTIEELKRIYKLSQTDYWSVSLTMEYLRLIKDNGNDEELKLAMNKAQTTVGMHFTRGHEVWALCRELTTEKYEDRDTNDELKKEQTIRELFCKQMRLPLDQNDLVMSEFRAWNTYNTRDAKASISAFEVALERQSKVYAPLMKKLKTYEANVNAMDNPEQNWQQYLNFVKHRVASVMLSEDEGKQYVVCLYERALSSVCLSSPLWTSYLNFVESSLTQSTLAVARRAVRNVPFDSSIWTRLLLEMECRNVNFEEVSQLIEREFFERSNLPLNELHLLSTLLTWCDLVRRHVSSSISKECSFEDTIRRVETQINNVFHECQQLIMRAYPSYMEGKLRLAEYHAKCYWTLLSMNRIPDMRVVDKMNELWQKTVCTGLGDYAATWIAYLDALLRTNSISVERIRQIVFDEAVQRVKESPLTLANSWLVFERENGDLTNYLRARRYYEKHCASVQFAASSDAVVLATDRDEPAENVKKRKASASKQSKPAFKQPDLKRAKANSCKSKKSSNTTPKSAEKKKQYEKLTNEHTLFLCNVSKNASKGDIEDLFRDIPTLKDVRLVVKTRGDRVLSRGMAYVQFSDEEGVEAGLKRNGFLLHGHPLRVERSKPPVTSASTAGKLNSQSFWKSDPLTLYIGYLNREGSKEQVTEEQLQVALQQSMQTAGELVVVTRVLILKDRHGKWKNYGLVEVAEPSQNAFCLANVAALQATLGDQVTITPSRFSIAHILEQQKKQQKQKLERKLESNSAKAPSDRPLTRLNIGSTTSLLPRACRRKSAVSTNVSETACTVPKTNEEFRKLFLK
ncbi:putative RNA recognition motif domain, tetratricopeptide-like helical domain superfamily [Plasmopara halstedii]